ncbi:MAG: hypothetical protein PHH70_03725 [Candidatus Gracilibacteria bacterium]|nr:hypothetical protein [Candidatus Gracilibacteria bacterium]
MSRSLSASILSVVLVGTTVLSLAEQQVSLEIGMSQAREILTAIHESGVPIAEETLLEEVFRQGKEQITRIHTNLNDKKMSSKEWWKSLIELIAIINFFTVLPWAYRKTINGAKKGTGTSPVTFGAFTVSNGLGMAASVISGAPLLGAGYAIAFYSAIQTVIALRNRKKLDARDKELLRKAQEKLQKLTEENVLLREKLQDQHIMSPGFSDNDCIAKSRLTEQEHGENMPEDRGLQK